MVCPVSASIWHANAANARAVGPHHSVKCHPLGAREVDYYRAPCPVSRLLVPIAQAPWRQGFLYMHSAS